MFMAPARSSLVRDVYKRQLQKSHQLGGRLLIEGLAIAEVPGLRIEAILAAMGTTGDKQGHADPRPVGHIHIFDVSIIPVSYTHLGIILRRWNGSLANGIVFSISQFGS